MRPAFSLIELVGSLALIGALLGILLPRTAAIVDGVHLRSAVSEVAEAFSVARAAAIRNNASSIIKIDAATSNVLVRTGADTVFRSAIGALFDVAVRSNRDSMIFTPLGVGYGAGNQTIVLTAHRAVDTIVVSRLGRVRH
jgi:Tfp pilus assembly protein FimT